MEETEHEFLRSLGLSVQLREDDTTYGFPRLSTRCEYSRPLQFEDVVEVELRVARVGRSSITYQFLFTSEGEEVARGEVSVACVVRDSEGVMRSSPIQSSLSSQLTAHAGEPLTFGPPSSRKR